MTSSASQAWPGLAAATPVPADGAVDRLHRLVAAQRAIATAPADLRTVLDVLVESVLAAVPARGVIISEPDGDELVATATAGVGMPPVGTRIPQVGTLAGACVRSLQGKICQDSQTDPRLRPEFPAEFQTRSFVVVPLVHDGAAIALISAAASSAYAFDENDLGLLEMLADVATARLLAAREREFASELESRSAAVLEAMAEGLVEMDGSGRVRFANASAQRMLGFTWDEAAGLTAEGSDWSFRWDDGRPREADTLPSSMTLRDGLPRHDEVLGVARQDGKSWWLLVSSVPRVENGVVEGVVSTFVDITARQEDAERLRAGEEYFRVAFDHAPIGMSLIGLSGASRGRYLRTNATFEAMLGRSGAEIAGSRIEELTHPDDVERDQGLFAGIVAQQTEHVAFEKRFRHRDGHTVHAWLTSTTVRGADGEPLFLLTHAMDISDQLRKQAELERLALTDTLTGLSNRTLFNDRLDHALARLQRTGQAVAMLFLDVDRFKTVNDSLGHQVGDALLVEMAGRIEAVSRADSTVARLGGDEFVVLVEGLATPDAVHAVAERLLTTLRRPYNLGPTAEALVATASIGVAVATDPGRVPGDLYREADLALYRAKDAGRDQYALFDDRLRARADRRMAAETMLRKAISDDLLVPVYQPIVDLQDGRVHAAEALARIRDGDDLLMPADFIDVAEETGLIVEVDARMFEKVAAEGSRLIDAGALLRRLTANVSARSLEDRSLVERMRKALTWYGVPGSMIRVELTERSLLHASPAVRESLARIRDLGVELGLDDFGTGYSALSYLQDLDLQFLKIDRSFVSRLGTTARDDAVVSAVVDLAHAHDLVVVAEGVETTEQLAALRAMGCDRAQGYLMGRPMLASDLDELLRTDPRW